MSDISDVFIYLDEILVKSLSSLMLTGYIDIRTSRYIKDRTITGRVNEGKKEQTFKENKCSNEQKEGYREANIINTSNGQNAYDNGFGFETREFERWEEEYKKIYTNFMLHDEVITGLTGGHLMKSYNNKQYDFKNKSLEGNYIELKGTIVRECMFSYLDILINTIECYGYDCLNKLLGDKKDEVLDFKVLSNILTHLKELLCAHDTQDLILMQGNIPIVLTVNNSCFLNKNPYIFDKLNCDCKVVGKVSKVCTGGDCINILRKTTQEEYYEKVLAKCDEMCGILEEKGVILPKRPTLKFEGKVLMVTPISIRI